MSLAFAVAGWVMQCDFARKNEPRDLAWEIVGLGLVGGVVATNGRASRSAAVRRCGCGAIAVP
jgi:hypothetical protein